MRTDLEARIRAEVERLESQITPAVLGGDHIPETRLRSRIAALEWVLTLLASEPATAPQSDDEIGYAGPVVEIDLAGEFKPCRIDLEDAQVTQWVFEDVAHVARPAFPGAYHFIDELIAMDDERLVGVAFWGRAASAHAPDAMPDTKIVEAVARSLARRRSGLTMRHERNAWANTHWIEFIEDARAVIAVAWPLIRHNVREKALMDAAKFVLKSQGTLGSINLAEAILTLKDKHHD